METTIEGLAYVSWFRPQGFSCCTGLRLKKYDLGLGETVIVVEFCGKSLNP